MLKPYESIIIAFRPKRFMNLYLDICPTAQKDECFSMEKVLPSEESKMAMENPPKGHRNILYTHMIYYDRFTLILCI